MRDDTSQEIWEDLEGCVEIFQEEPETIDVSTFFYMNGERWEITIRPHSD